MEAEPARHGPELDCSRVHSLGHKQPAVGGDSVETAGGDPRREVKPAPAAGQRLSAAIKRTARGITRWAPVPVAELDQLQQADRPGSHSWCCPIEGWYQRQAVPMSAKGPEERRINFDHLRRA